MNTRIAQLIAKRLEAIERGEGGPVEPPKVNKRAAGEKARLKQEREGLKQCRVCGCRPWAPCKTACRLLRAEADLCDTCESAVEALLTWAANARRANVKALMSEFAKESKPKEEKT